MRRSVDFCGNSRTICAMSAAPSSSPRRGVNRGLVLESVLCLGAFGFLAWIIAPHVPSVDTRMITLWSSLAAACMTAVFWLCLQMFRVVLVAQRERDQGRK